MAIVGAGAAGIAVTKLLLAEGAGDVILVDSQAIISRNRKDMNGFKNEMAKITNKNNMAGPMAEAIKKVDILIGLSVAGLFKPEHIKSMNVRPIVFALANPVPEIMPKDAMKAGAAVVATGRSDFTNQVNNVLAFPGIFRGALDARAPQITEAMKMAAAKALADCVKIPTKDKILPDPLDKKVVQVIAAAVKKAAK